ncbi:MAG TPA: hypothetical protein DDW50_02615 [Firmicutes bacterium]|jgi:hypothetical protein|nr:hypothetical protein [Bacillota bacterium]
MRQGIHLTHADRVSVRVSRFTFCSAQSNPPQPFSVIIPISLISGSDCLPIQSLSEPLIDTDSPDFADFSGYQFPPINNIFLFLCPRQKKIGIHLFLT